MRVLTTFAFVLASASVSNAAVVQLQDNAAPLFISGRFLQVTADGQNTFSSLDFVQSTDSTASLDDDADVASVVGATIQNTLRNERPSGGVTITKITGPPNFPDPNPTTETITYHIALSIDAFDIGSGVQLASSNTVPITDGSSGTFSFRPTVTLSFPDSFTITGSLSIDGPQTDVTTPFSVKFNRQAKNPEVSGLLDGRVQVGSNYPSTASLTLRGSGGSRGITAFYIPETTTILNQSIDGVTFKGTFSNAPLRGFAVAPEPSSFGLASLAIGALAARVRSKRRH